MQNNNNLQQIALPAAPLSPLPTSNKAPLSTAFAIEARNNVLNTVSTMLDNLQQILLTYNKAFTVPIQSITKSINNYSTIQQIQSISSQCLWKSLLNDIANCIILQEQIWKDINNQKCIADNQLINVHQAVMQLQQQKIILIDNPSNNILNIRPTMPTMPTMPIMPILPPLTTNIINNTSNGRLSDIHIHGHNIINSTKPGNSENIPFKQLYINNNTENNNNNNNNDNNNNNNNNNKNINNNHSKKKRKRRGYNGPYSEEEQNFLRNWQNNETPQDILRMSNEMENKFKVKRSPYGLAQKMYQMGIINSRLKAIFQRQLEKENKDNKDNKDISNDNHSIHSNSSINDSDTVCSSQEIKKRPFTLDEVNYIRDELINNYHNEQPRKLYWRFIQRFSDWKNDSKSYQKFYHKYWILTNEKKERDKFIVDNEEKNDDILDMKKEDDFNNNSLHNLHRKKRSINSIGIGEIQYPQIVPPHKKIKLQLS